MVKKAFLGIVLSFGIFACSKNNIIPDEEDLVDKIDSTELSANFNSIVADNENIVWIGTDSGLLGYDGVNWKLIQKSTEIPIASDSISDLASDSQGIWMASEKGITYLKLTFEEVLSTEVYLKEQTGYDIVTKVDAGINNDCWFGTPDGIILKDGENWPKVSHFYSSSNFKSYPITSIANINDTCYAGTNGGGVVRYFKDIDGVTGASALWPGNGGGLASSTVNCVYVDESNFLWLGLPSGVQKHTDSNPKITGNNWFLYTEDDGLIQNNVNAIVQDKTGNMWFGTNGGISKYDGNNWFSFTRSNGLSNDTILDLTVDLNNHIWALSNSSLSFFDGSKWTAVEIPKSVPIIKN